MDRDSSSTSASTNPSTSTSCPSSTSTLTSGRPSRERTPHGPPHPDQPQHHQLPNRSTARQTRHQPTAHRESQHYPMAERCMCSSCHLSARLFPRNESGRIMLPTVPVTRSPSVHVYAPAHGYNGGGDGGCVGENGDLVQYMVVPNESGNSGHGRPPSSSISGTFVSTGPYDPNVHYQGTGKSANLARTSAQMGAAASGSTQVHSTLSAQVHPEYSTYPGSTLDGRMHFDQHLAHVQELIGRGDVDGDGDTEMKAMDPTSLIGPGVAGATGLQAHHYHHPTHPTHPPPPPHHTPHHHHSHPHSHHPPHPHPERVPGHQGLRDFEHPYEYEYKSMAQVPDTRTPSGSYGASHPLSPPPVVNTPINPPSQLPHPNMHIAVNPVPPPQAGRGRPKGKGKGKGKAKAVPAAVAAATMMDNSSDGSSENRDSPMMMMMVQGSSGSAPLAAISAPQDVMTGSVDGEAAAVRAPPQQQQMQLQAQMELAPCKPRRGRPPRHEVVPGMGEFTVFL